VFSVTSKTGCIHSIALGLRTNNPFSGPQTTSIVATSRAMGSSERRQKMMMATTANTETKIVSSATL
jgi:hypothetical protein